MRFRSHSIDYRAAAPILPFFETSLASTMAVKIHELLRPAPSPKVAITDAARDVVKDSPIESLSLVDISAQPVSAPPSDH